MLTAAKFDENRKASIYTNIVDCFRYITSFTIVLSHESFCYELLRDPVFQTCLFLTSSPTKKHALRESGGHILWNYTVSFCTFFFELEFKRVIAYELRD